MQDQRGVGPWPRHAGRLADPHASGAQLWRLARMSKCVWMIFLQAKGERRFEGQRKRSGRVGVGGGTEGDTGIARGSVTGSFPNLHLGQSFLPQV